MMYHFIGGKTILRCCTAGIFILLSLTIIFSNACFSQSLFLFPFECFYESPNSFIFIIMMLFLPLISGIMLYIRHAFLGARCVKFSKASPEKKKTDIKKIYLEIDTRFTQPAEDSYCD